MECACYSLKRYGDKVIICEFDADVMPSHAAIDIGEYCVSRSKENIYHIAEVIFPGIQIEYHAWGED